MKRFNVTVNGKAYDVAVEEIAGGAAVPAPVQVPVQAAAPAPVPAAVAPAPAAAGSTRVESPMPGTILDIKVTAGQAVEANQVLVILEAMKMENEIAAPNDGTVKSIAVGKGASVNAGDVLVVVG